MVACHQAVLVTTFSWLLGGACCRCFAPHRGGRNESAVGLAVLCFSSFTVLLVSEIFFSKELKIFVIWFLVMTFLGVEVTVSCLATIANQNVLLSKFLSHPKNTKKIILFNNV